MKIKILVVAFGLTLFILGATAGFILSPSQRKNISPIIDERKIEDSFILENKEIKRNSILLARYSRVLETFFSGISFKA